MTLLLCLLLVAEPGAGLPLREVLARHSYASAVTYLQQALTGKPSDAFALRTLARIYDHQHLYDSSLIWWERALKLDPNHDSTITGRWNALYNRDKEDSLELPVTKAAIAADAAVYSKGTTPRELTLAYDGFSLADSARAVNAALELARRFPDSPRGYELIGTMFYDSLYPVWTNDTLKVPIIRRFLTRYPGTEWRQTFHIFLLSSLFGLKDTVQLRSAAREMTQDDTLDPFRCRYAAAIFNRLRFDPATAEAYARRAVALEPAAKKPANKPQEQWDLEYPVLYGQARLALAEALMAQNKLDEAHRWLSDAEAKFKWDSNSEWTPAPFITLMAEIAERQGDTARALLGYASAVSTGDSRNLWTMRADSGLKRIRPSSDREIRDWFAAAMDYEGPGFSDVTDSFGLKDRRESRVAWGDYNNDGFQDLLLSGCVLFRNDSGHGFTNVTDSAGLQGASGRGGLFADFNNDGWLDLYVAGASGGARFYKNDSGRFLNLSDRAGGPGDDYPTEGAGWADYDNDGWVDLYCANYENWEKHTYYPDKLFQNQRGYLSDVTKKAGVIPPYGVDLAGRGVNWADFDDDGDQDCYVSNYRLCENFLWVNKGDSTFTNLAGQLGVSGDEVNGWYGHTIGSTWGDYDNDGDLDLFTADLAHPRYIEFSNRSRLYENLGHKASPRFRDRRADSGIRYEETHSDPAWADVDNDGDLDLYVTSIYEGRRSFLYENGVIGLNYDKIEGERFRTGRYPEPERQLPPRFSEVTWFSGTRVFNGWGCAFADFDNDGDQDLVVGSGSGVKLFRNEVHGNHWLEVKVVGTRASRAGIGARVTVIQGRTRQIREVEGGKGTMSQNSLIQHFGLGRNDTPVTVEVRFGPKSTVVLKNVKPDQLLTVQEQR